jgi:hypothetical protein
VYVCEGEKAAEAGKKVDLLCTTSAHGSVAAHKSDWSVLAGKEVIIFPDHDAPGMHYAQTVASILLKLKEPAKVKIVELPGAKEGDDLFDYLQDMRDGDWQEIRTTLDTLVDGVPWLSLEQLPEKIITTPQETSGPMLTVLSEVKPEAIQWLWEGKLALGKLAGWAGAPGDGKSIASLDVAARITTGADWPDGSKSIAGSVLLISSEDGLADTVRPRLDAHGADVSKVHHFSAIKRVVNGRSYQELFTLKQIRELDMTLKNLPDCRLVIIDPVGSFFGIEADSNGDAAVRSVLAPIAALAEQCNVAVLLVMHTRKEAGERADDAVMGSRAFTGIVRSMWHIRRDEQNPERRLFLPGKNNSARAVTGLAYKVVDQNGVAKVVWEPGPVEMPADEAVKRGRAGEGGADLRSEHREEIQQWLEKQLANGPKPAGTSKNGAPQPGTIIEEARAMGYAWRTVQRAASNMGVMRAKQGNTTVWLLPSLEE